MGRSPVSTSACYERSAREFPYQSSRLAEPASRLIVAPRLRRAAPTRCWRPRSSIAISMRSTRSRPRWPGRASPSASRRGLPEVAIDPREVRWDDAGLVPAVVQDVSDGRVLMLAYVDEEALAATARTGEVHFHSRSRDRLWRKGETSGNMLHLVDLGLDCDADALLVKAHPTGPVCHTGSATCFSKGNEATLSRFLSELAGLLRQRRRDLPADSFSAELFRGGGPPIAGEPLAQGRETAL